MAQKKKYETKITPPPTSISCFPLSSNKYHNIVSMSIITGYLIRANYYSLQHLHTMPQSHYHLITMRLNKAEKWCTLMWERILPARAFCSASKGKPFDWVINWEKKTKQKRIIGTFTQLYNSKFFIKCVPPICTGGLGDISKKATHVQSVV